MYVDLTCTVLRQVLGWSQNVWSFNWLGVFLQLCPGVCVWTRLPLRRFQRHGIPTRKRRTVRPKRLCLSACGHVFLHHWHNAYLCRHSRVGTPSERGCRRRRQSFVPDYAFGHSLRGTFCSWSLSSPTWRPSSTPVLATWMRLPSSLWLPLFWTFSSRSICSSRIQKRQSRKRLPSPPSSETTQGLVSELVTTFKRTDPGKNSAVHESGQILWQHVR